MKKLRSNIGVLLILASTTFVACTNEDNFVEDEQPSDGYIIAVAASMDDAAQTRALELDGSKLKAKWVNGEQVTVTKGTEVVGTLTATNTSDDGKTCDFMGIIKGEFAANDELTLSYHPIEYSDLTTLGEAFAAQEGTLESASELDCATATVSIASVSGNKITISESSASFITETAVLKITMTDGTDPINATTLKLGIPSFGVEIFDFSFSSDVYTTNGDGVIYLSVPSYDVVKSVAGFYASLLSTMDLTFTASDGTNTYTKNVKGYPFEAAKYYATTLAMSKK